MDTKAHTVTVEHVNPADVLDIWPDIEEYLAAANRYNDGRITIYQWLARILDGHVDLYVTSNMESAAVCEVVNYQSKRVYHVSLFGADNMESCWEEYQKVLTRAARRLGCYCLESKSRPGFTKFMKERGAKLLHCTFVLEI